MKSYIILTIFITVPITTYAEIKCNSLIAIDGSAAQMCMSDQPINSFESLATGGVIESTESTN